MIKLLDVSPTYHANLKWPVSFEKYVSHFDGCAIWKWRSGRLLFKTKWALFQLCYGVNKLHFDEMMMSCLYHTRPTVKIFIVLAHRHNSLCLDISLHSDTHYSDSEPTMLCSYSLVLHALRRSNKYQCYSLWGSLDCCSNPWSTALEASTLTAKLKC
jgi:hypothetical protein